MSFYLQLTRAKKIKRDSRGMPFTWQSGETLVTFTDPRQFLDYVRANAADLKDVIAFTGSASLLLSANAYITDELKKVGVLA